MRYSHLDHAIGFSAAEDAFNRIREWEEVKISSPLKKIAEALSYSYEASFGPAKAHLDELVMGRSLAQEFAVNNSLLADLGAKATFMTARDTAVLEAISGKAVLEKALGLGSPFRDQISALGRATAQAVVDKLNFFQAEMAANLRQKIDTTMLLEREKLNLYDRNTFPTLDWQRISGTLGVAEALRRTTIEMLESYRALGRSSVDSTFGALSFSLAEFPSIEVYAHTNVLRALSLGGTAKSKEQDQEEDPRFRKEVAERSSTTLQELLVVHHPDLAHMWHGAKAVLHSGNSDYVRQYSCSQRELLLQLLRRVAPDNEVRKWTTDPDHFRNNDKRNQPTLRARILYLCAKADYQRLGCFVVADAKSALKIYDQLNKGVHQVRTSFSRREITDLQIRADNLLLFILLFWLEARN